MRDDPPILEFGRFSFSVNPFVVNYEKDELDTLLEIEYGYSTEDSPPVDIWDHQFLNKEEVGRMITFLQKQYEDM